jgi:hypothetical protein
MHVSPRPAFGGVMLESVSDPDPVREAPGEIPVPEVLLNGDASLPVYSATIQWVALDRVGAISLAPATLVKHWERTTLSDPEALFHSDVHPEGVEIVAGDPEALVVQNITRALPWVGVPFGNDGVVPVPEATDQPPT